MKKRYITILTLAFILGACLFFLSSAVKWYIVKNSKELIGRRVSIEKLHINYLRFSIKVKNFVMYEASEADSFAAFGEFYVNFDPWNLLKNEYAFSEIRLTDPKIIIIQNRNHFNFSDLLHPSDTTKVKKDTSSSNIRFLVQNIKIAGGWVSYTDKQIDNNISLQNINLDIPKIAWNSNQSDMGISFRIGERGVVSISATLNNQKNRYSVALNTQDLNMGMITNYLKQYMNISSLNGFLTTNIALTGSLDTTTNVQIKGHTELNHLSVIDNKSSQILATDKISIDIKDVDLGQLHFGFSSIVMTNTQILAILDKDKSNFEKILRPSLQTDSTTNTPKDTTESMSKKQATFSIDTLQLKNSSITFNDNTLNRPFVYNLKDINITLTGLTESATDIPIVFNMILNDKGSLKGSLKFNMLDSKDLKANIRISNMDLISFSPYSEYYIASPITQGQFNYEISVNMNKTKLVNQNQLRINRLKFGKRLQNQPIVKAPVRLALYIINDPQNKIAIDLPVEGNPSDPKFSYSKILWKTAGNFCVKVASEPFNAMSGLVTTRPEDINTLPFEPAQDTLNTENLNTVHQIAELARKKPELTFIFSQYTNIEKEKEQIAIILAKKQFLQTKNIGSDSLDLIDRISKLSLTDTDFKTYLAANVENGSTLDPAKACKVLIGDSRLETELLQKINRRNWSLQKALGLYEKLPEEAFKIETADLHNLPDELKTTMYKIEVALSE